MVVVSGLLSAMEDENEGGEEERWVDYKLLSDGCWVARGMKTHGCLYLLRADIFGPFIHMVNPCSFSALGDLPPRASPPRCIHPS